MKKRADIELLRNAAGQTLMGPKLRGAQIEGSKTLWSKDGRKICPQSFEPLNLPPEEFWAAQSGPAGFWSNAMSATLSHGDLVGYYSFALFHICPGQKWHIYPDNDTLAR